jgi:Nucleotidyltransferase domain
MMPGRSSGLLKDLSDRPDIERLEQYLTRIVGEHGVRLEFIVLFGSMARGDWSRGSDYDLFIGLAADDGRRLIERMAEFDPAGRGDIEVFPYSHSEWQRMFREYHLLLLEALAHGVVLWDRGEFARMRQAFQTWRERGDVVPWLSGWKIRFSGPANGEPGG